MIALVVAVSLIATLLLVHFSLRTNPMPRARPLDVDSGLPFPEAGQASTVFSLTALFGAYLGIHLLLGLSALLGLATGTVVALFIIRNWIDQSNAKSFDDFLFRILRAKPNDALIFALCLSAIQCGYASSELAILQNVVDASLGLRSDHATLLVTALGVIAYFYILFGGYMAVFRADVLQFLLLAAMGGVLLLAATEQGRVSDLHSFLHPRPGYWLLPSLVHARFLLHIYHFLIGAVMGLSFLLTSPDAWKRIFLVSAARRKSHTRFALFAIAGGGAPFLLLVPLGMVSAPIPDGPIDASAFWKGLLSSDILFTAIALGLISSFLSAFNGAFLASVHVGLAMKRHLQPTRTERSRFHWLMVSTLLTVFLVFAAIRSFGNPYILGNLLLGPYAILAGVLFATRGTIQRLPTSSLPWVVVGGFVAWFIYFTAVFGLPNAPATGQLNSIPGGMAFFGLSGVVSYLLMAGGRMRGRS